MTIDCKFAQDLGFRLFADALMQLLGSCFSITLGCALVVTDAETFGFSRSASTALSIPLSTCRVLANSFGYM